MKISMVHIYLRSCKFMKKYHKNMICLYHIFRRVIWKNENKIFIIKLFLEVIHLALLKYPLKAFCKNIIILYKYYDYAQLASKKDTVKMF